MRSKPAFWASVFWVLASFLTASTLCEAAASVTEVLAEGRKLRVDISGTSWKNGQVVCAMRDTKRIACGLLVEKNGSTGVVGLDFRNQMPVVGDRVVTASEAKTVQDGARERAPSSTAAPAHALAESSAIHYRSGGRDDYMVSGISVWDLDQISIGVAAEAFVSPRVTYALEFSSYDISDLDPFVDGYGVMLRRAFRATRTFRGVYLALGAGAYFFKVSPSTNAVSFVVQGNAGWALQLTRWLNASLGVGVSYITHPKVTGSPLGTFHLLRPWFGISLGVPF